MSNENCVLLVEGQMPHVVDANRTEVPILPPLAGVGTILSPVASVDGAGVALERDQSALPYAARMVARPYDREVVECCRTIPRAREGKVRAMVMTAFTFDSEMTRSLSDQSGAGCLKPIKLGEIAGPDVTLADRTGISDGASS